MAVRSRANATTGNDVFMPTRWFYYHEPADGNRRRLTKDSPRVPSTDRGRCRRQEPPSRCVLGPTSALLFRLLRAANTPERIPTAIVSIFLRPPFLSLVTHCAVPGRFPCCPVCQVGRFRSATKRSRPVRVGKRGHLDPARTPAMLEPPRDPRTS